MPIAASRRERIKSCIGALIGLFLTEWICRQFLQASTRGSWRRWARRRAAVRRAGQSAGTAVVDHRRQPRGRHGRRGLRALDSRAGWPPAWPWRWLSR
jgi:hypothetical protein